MDDTNLVEWMGIGTPEGHAECALQLRWYLGPYICLHFVTMSRIAPLPASKPCECFYTAFVFLPQFEDLARLSSQCMADDGEGEFDDSCGGAIRHRGSRLLQGHVDTKAIGEIDIGRPSRSGIAGRIMAGAKTHRFETLDVRCARVCSDDDHRKNWSTKQGLERFAESGR